MTFSSRNMAIAAGQKYYSAGKKCMYNHNDCRYTKSGVCVECHRIRSKKKAESVKRAFMDRGLGLVRSEIGIHPDDLKTVESFIKALLFDRGIY